MRKKTETPKKEKVTPKKEKVTPKKEKVTPKKAPNPMERDKNVPKGKVRRFDGTVV